MLTYENHHINSYNRYVAMHRKGIVHVHTKFQINALFSVAVISYVVRYLLYTYVTLNYVECGTQAVKNII